MAAGTTSHLERGLVQGEPPSKKFQHISDPIERTVLEAVADPKWDFRTISGIAKETGLSESDVKRVLEKNPALVRQSLVPGRQGRGLFTLQERPIEPREKLGLLQVFLTKSIT